MCKTELEGQKQALGRVQDLLSDARKEVESTSSNYVELVKTAKAAEAAEMELRYEHMDLQQKLSRAVRDRKVAQAEVSVARDTAKENMNRLLSQTADEMSRLREQSDAAVKKYEDTMKTLGATVKAYESTVRSYDAWASELSSVWQQNVEQSQVIVALNKELLQSELKLTTDRLKRMTEALNMEKIKPAESDSQTIALTGRLCSSPN